MKQVLSFLILLCLVGSFCVVSAFASKEISSEDLLAQVPDFAHTGNDESIATISDQMEAPNNTLKIFFKGLYQDGAVPEDMEEFFNPPTEEEFAACPKVSVEDVCKTYNRLFGPNASDRLKINEMKAGSVIGTGMVALHLSQDKQTFTYVPYHYGGGIHFATRRAVVRSESVGEDIVVYAVFAKISAYGDTVFYLRDNVTSNATVLMDIKKADWEGKTYPWDLLDAGIMDEYLPVYKHTFKPNGDGTYYWAKTELETAGKEIPLSVLSTSVEVVSTNTASGAETDLPTSDTGTKTDLPTSDTQTDLPTESNPVDSSAPTDSGTAGNAESSPLWIYVTVGLAVAVAAALGIFFAVKKKKA